MTAFHHKKQFQESPSENQQGDDIERTVSGSNQQQDTALSHQQIINAFIFFGRDREDAEQWIKTCLRQTCIYLEQSLLIEPMHWIERYPTTPLEEIQKALRSDIGAALWYLSGGVQEKYRRSNWTPLPGIEYSIRTKELLKHLAAHPENPADIAATNQIERLQKELQRISKKIRNGKARLPYRLKSAPDWKLVVLGPKGPGKGHRFLRANSHTTPITRAELNKITEARNSGHVLIEDDDD